MIYHSKADIVKQQLSMQDICSKYGFEPDRRGYISCPFHNEKTPSLKIYAEPGRGFHCYGCGVGGSVIDFVMNVFGISFQMAILRLDTDFALGLSNQKASRKTLQEHRLKIQKEKEQLEAYRKDYDARCELYRNLFFASQNLKPKNMDEEMLPIFVDILHLLDILDDWFVHNQWR